jgi:hypothetical protein
LTNGLGTVTIADMVALLVFIGCIVAFLALVFWYGVLRGEQNAYPAIGTNRPYPEGVGPTGPGADEAPYLPTFIVSDTEEFRRNADRELTRMHRNSGVKARSWMDEPGAMEAAGLVDGPVQSTDAGGPADPPHRPHRPKKHH